MAHCHKGAPSNMSTNWILNIRRVRRRKDSSPAQMTDSVFISALSCFFPAVILSLFVLPLLLHFPTFIPHVSVLMLLGSHCLLEKVLLIPTDIRGTENGRTGQNQQTRSQLVLRFVSILTLSLHPFFFFFKLSLTF